MRKVIYSEQEKGEDGKWRLVEKGKAFFHQFGIDYEYLNDLLSVFTTAIIELEDGRVLNIPVANIRFLGPPAEIVCKQHSATAKSARYSTDDWRRGK